MEITVTYLTSEEMKINDNVLYKHSVYDSRYDRVMYVWSSKSFDLKKNKPATLVFDYAFDFKKSIYKLKLVDIIQ